MVAKPDVPSLAQSLLELFAFSRVIPNQGSLAMPVDTSPCGEVERRHPFLRTCIGTLRPAMGKSSVLSLLVESLAREEQINREHAENLIRDLLEMERRGSSAVKGGIALPHLETSLIHHMVGGIGIAREGLHFDSSDGEPTHLIFLILAPPGHAQRISQLRLQLATVGRQLVAQHKTGPPLMCHDVFSAINNLVVNI